MKKKQDIVKEEASITVIQKSTYLSARQYVIDAQAKIYKAVNSAMVTAYWNIGKLIYEACGKSERAVYGKQLMQYLSEN